MSDQATVKQMDRRQLRWAVRQLVQHHLQVVGDDYETFMGVQSIMWHLAGRPGLSLEDQHTHAEAAHVAVLQLLDASPVEHNCLRMAAQCSEEMTRRAEKKLGDVALLADAAADFSEWASEGVPTFEEVKTALEAEHGDPQGD